MKFALVNGTRSTATPGLRGICQGCSGTMIAKCGQYVIWHWAHKQRQNCDSWWETETDWHRTWKDQFPIEQQEVVQIDPLTGEKHIADVKIGNGLVIEFQHSPISVEELKSREQFYKKMIWIVDGARLPTDEFFLRDGTGKQQICDEPIAFTIEWYGRSKLLHRWSEATTPVYLDRGDGILWRLHSFDSVTKRGIVALIMRDDLIKACVDGFDIPPANFSALDAIKRPIDDHLAAPPKKRRKNRMNPQEAPNQQRLPF